MDDVAWWKKGIIYEIYPRSFQDSNGDGVGDLGGILARLDYLTWLGVDGVWISPIYPSPMADFGYDVSDYCNVDPLFGTLGDFERLVTEAHKRGLKVILDFVPNHTSETHPWFRESRSSRTNSRRDWYIWRDGKKSDAPPNNWLSQFGGPAWTLDPATNQYYLHSFLRQQPDLNWRNPAVRDAMFEVLRFWLNRGVDGFRVDVIWLLIKDAAFRDNPSNPAYRPTEPAINRYLSVYNADQPEIHDVIAGMRAVLDSYPDRVLIGEIYLPLERLVAYYGKDLAGAHLPFNFALIHTAWNASAIANLIVDYEGHLPPGGWPNWVLGNHDQPRIAARVGPAQARIAAMLLLTLRGTPTMYYGDEIGLNRVAIASELAQDPWERTEPGLGVGRDHWRTPFQWDDSNNAGFSAIAPWLPLAENYRECNVTRLRQDAQSILLFYRRLIQIRKQHPALTVGGGRVMSSDGNVLYFERSHQNENLIIVLNFGPDTSPLSGIVPADATVLLSTHMDFEGPVGTAMLRGNEGIIVQVSS